MVKQSHTQSKARLSTWLNRPKAPPQPKEHPAFILARTRRAEAVKRTLGKERMKNG